MPAPTSGTAGLTIHAGLPKAGSSAIQSWLAGNAERLRRSHGIAVAVAREGDPIRTVLYDGSGSINSVDLVTVMTWEPDRRAAALRAFLGDLDALCGSHEQVVVTSEAFATLLWRPDEDFVLGLEDLASRHPVRIAYYVRPQHAALEAAWKQWGFRAKGPPSLFLTLRAEHMDYVSAHAKARDLAPNVELIPRAARADLLAGGDVVADFAGRVLGLDEPSFPGEIVNPGLPLEVVNLLRAAPKGMFWESMHDNGTLNEVKQVLGDLEWPRSDRIQRSRAVLQAYCHARFEQGNLELSRRLGCSVSEWIPAPDDDVRGDLAELDSLWAPHGSAAEREAFYASILRALGR